MSSFHLSLSVHGGDQEFSFAYLKELFLSSMMRWIALPERSHMDEVMREQVASLREQMRDVEELLTDQSYPPGIPGWHHGRMMPHRGPHPMHPQDVPL